MKRKSFLLLAAVVFLFLPKNVLAANFGDVVINEIYYDVCSKDICGGNRGDEGKNEWVEVYNSGKEDVNLKGWRIKDATDSERIIIEDDLFLRPEQFVLITNDVSTWSLWDIPDEVLKIALGSNIGGGLNNDKDKVILIFSDDDYIAVEYGVGDISDVAEGRSLERIPAGTGSFIEQKEPTPGRGIFFSPTSTPTSTITPTVVSAITPTPTRTPAKATYQINKVKNEDGDILSSVKVYIDDQYIHHYAPEVLEFCDECYCDDDKEVECGFGEHTIRLEKSGYQDWTEAKVINAGDSHIVDPIMIFLLSLTLTPTAIPVISTTTFSSPTLPVSSSWPAPRSVLKVYQDSTPSVSPRPEVLGRQSSGQEKVLPPLLFWSGGIFYIAFPIYRLKKQWYNDFNEKDFVLD